MRALSFFGEEVPMPRMDDDEMKQLVKTAIKEWLDEEFAVFGKWSARAVVAAALAALVYWILSMNGWHR